MSLSIFEIISLIFHFGGQYEAQTLLYYVDYFCRVFNNLYFRIDKFNDLYFANVSRLKTKYKFEKVSTAVDL